MDKTAQPEPANGNFALRALWRIAAVVILLGIFIAAGIGGGFLMLQWLA